MRHRPRSKEQEMQGNDKAARAIALKLKASEVGTLLYAYKQLDSYDDVVRQGDEKRAVRVPFRFRGRVYDAIAKNCSAMRGIAEATSAAEQQLLKSLLPEGVQRLHAKTHPEQWAAYDAGVKEIMDAESEVTLVPIAREDLGDEPVLPSVREVLMRFDLLTD
jgi:hypothetical protein